MPSRGDLSLNPRGNLKHGKLEEAAKEGHSQNPDLLVVSRG